MINITSQRTVALVTVLALLFSLAPFNAVQFAFADHDPFGGEEQDKVNICHFLGNDSYNQQPDVSINAVLGGTGHGGHGNDIIPPFHYDGGEFPGQNWDSETEQIWNNGGCDGEVEEPAQCSNNEDDDEDGLTDEDDPGCHTDGNPENSDSYDPEDDDETDEVQTPQCSDNVDNEDAEDNLADELDPGCHTDGDAENSESYDPNDNDETDEAGPGEEICGNDIDDDEDGQTDEDCTEICGDGLDNDGDEQIDENCPEICDNQQDDDGDELVDSNDPDCQDVPLFQCDLAQILHLVSDPYAPNSLDSPLYSVDPATGDDTLLATFENTQFHFTLAIDSLAEVFSLRDDYMLTTLNSDGSVDEIGATSGFETVIAMGFAASGELYAMDQDTDKLYEMDPTDGSTVELGVITEEGNSENELNVYGGDLVVNEHGKIIYVRGNDAGDPGDPGVGSVFEIDIDSRTYVKLGELSNGEVDVFLITSLAQLDDTYYALERTDSLYKFTLDPFDFSVTNDGTRQYSVGDAATCPVPFDDEEEDDGSIAGKKFDTQDNELANWIIYLYNEAGELVDDVLTDENGNYIFEGLTNGDYTVCEEDKQGWAQTSPAEGADCEELDTDNSPEGHEVTLNDADNTSEGNNFVNNDLEELCENQQDDDEDGLVDDNDPDCDEGGGDDTQCSDGEDNEDAEDELADEQDPGCWEDPNDSGTYDETDNDETDPTDVCPNDEGIQTNESQCTEEQTESSSTGGSGGGTVLVASCDAVPSSTTTGTLVTFSADVNAVADEPVSFGWAGAVNGSGQQISTTFFSPGTYVALVSALDADGRNDTATCSVEVSGTAIPPFTGLPGGAGGEGGEGGGGGAGAGGAGGTGGGIAQLTDDEAGEGSGTSTAQTTDEEEVEDEGPGFLAGIIDFLNGGIVLWIIIILLILLVLWWLFGRRKDDEDKGQVNPR